MRALALAAVFGLVTLAGAAAADPWTDPNGNLIINPPHGWTVRPRGVQGATVVLAFTPSSDCYFYAVPNPATTQSTIHSVQHTTAPLTPETWAAASQGVPDFFEAGAPTVVSQSVDTSGFWPVQHAVLQSGSRTVQAELQVRPGFELRGFCSGSEASYDAILNSMSHPHDAAWQEQGAAEAAAAAAAPPPAAEQPQQPQRRQRRERGVTRGDSSEQPGSGM